MSRSAIGCLLLVASSLTFAQQPQFRSSVTQIEVDVFVTDSRGEFVRDLRPEEIEILEDGQLQALSAFSLIDLPVGFPRSQESISAEEDVTGNMGTADRRLWVMLLDTPAGGGGSPTYTRRTQNVARRFVEEAMVPGDMMAVVHVQGTSRSSQALTHSKRLLLESIERFSMGSSSTGPETGTEGITRVTDTLSIWQTLQATFLLRIAMRFVRLNETMWPSTPSNPAGSLPSS